MTEMEEQFLSCDYGELTNCVRARIRWIRERRDFLHHPDSRNWRGIRNECILRNARDKFEIQWLLKERRKRK